ncbi:hypothetical protein LIS04_36 [Listeria phage LIS04]|nr:hypothetical protein LIS04_36 [Listeria phage LIS04]
MIEFDYLKVQLKDVDLQRKIVKHLSRVLPGCSEPQMLNPHTWVLWCDTTYKDYQLEKRIHGELEDVEIELNNTTHRFREIIQVKCMKRDEDKISATLFF